MGQRYAETYDENGNVIDPSFWVENNNAFAGELNGGLDRDNLPAATIAAAEVTGDPFNTVRSSSSTTNYAPDMSRTDWQGGAGTGANGIDNVEWTTSEDAHYDIYWSGRWSWSGGTYSRVQAGAAGDRPNDTSPETDAYDTVTLRITVDGVTVATAGPFEDGANLWGTAMLGSIQLPAGTHTLRVECMCVRLRWQQEGIADRECINAITFADRSRLILQRTR